MAITPGANGNTDSNTEVGVLNDVWDEANHLLRTGPGSLAGGNPPSTKTTGGPPAAGQTAKIYTGSQVMTGGGSVALETVTNGKTFYITDIILSTDNTAVTDIKIQAAGATIFEQGIQATSPCNAAGLDTQPVASSGQAVTLVFPSVTSKTVYYYIAGYEQ